MEWKKEREREGGAEAARLHWKRAHLLLINEFEKAGQRNAMEMGGPLSLSRASHWRVAAKEAIASSAVCRRFFPPKRRLAAQEKEERRIEAAGFGLFTAVALVYVCVCVCV